MVLKFFNADPLEYNVVFTPSATGSLKLVGETFPWTKYSQFRQGPPCTSQQPYPLNALPLFSPSQERFTLLADVQPPSSYPR